MADGTRQAEGTSAASLHLAVTDEDGRPALGNVFVVVRHEESGQKWRGLRYSLKAKAYHYRGLPPGRFSISVSAAGYDPSLRDVVLRDGESSRVEMRLEPISQAAPLILDTGEELDAYQRFVREMYHRRDVSEQFCDAPAETLHQYLSGAGAGSDAPPTVSPQVTILAALINDRRVIDTLTRPIHTFSPAALSEWVEAQLLGAWEFRAPEFMLDRVIGPVVECRVRLLALVRAVMANAHVRTLFAGLDDAAVTAHMLRFLASLERPQLDEVIPILIQMINPNLAPVERFARSLLATFDARVPVGAATPRRGDTTQAPLRGHRTFDAGIEEICRVLLREPGRRRRAASAPDEDADVRERASTVTFALADIAGCLAAALDPSPSCMLSLRQEGAYT